MESQGSERTGPTEATRARRPLRRWWPALLAPLLAYAVAIGLAYWRPPVEIGGLSTGFTGGPYMAVIEVWNRGRVPVRIESVEVAGVLPPDEVHLVTPVPGVLPTVRREHARGEGIEPWPAGGWRLAPTPPPPERGVPGILLMWYPTVDLRWLHCPTVRYRYLGWPMVARGFCNDVLRWPSVHTGGDMPSERGDWRSAGGGVRYLVHRTEEDLFIEFAPEPGASPGEIVLNGFTEEAGGGRARFRFRLITLTDRPTGKSLLVSVPVRWGEPDPDVEIEVVRFEDWRDVD